MTGITAHRRTVRGKTGLRKQQVEMVTLCANNMDGYNKTRQNKWGREMDRGTRWLWWEELSVFGRGWSWEQPNIWAEFKRLHRMGFFTFRSKSRLFWQYEEFNTSVKHAFNLMQWNFYIRLISLCFNKIGAQVLQTWSRNMWGRWGVAGGDLFRLQVWCTCQPGLK